MALNIKNEEADRLARRLADVTGESLTEAVTVALEERLERVEGRVASLGLRTEIERMQERISRLPRCRSGSDEELVGYDERGLPDGGEP